MNTLLLEATEDSPYIFFNPEKGHLKIEGRSLMVDSNTYLMNMIDWLRNYIINPRPCSIIELHLEHINSRSHNMLIYFLGEINKYFIMGHSFEVIWMYHEDDEYLKDVGEELKSMFDVPIKELALT
ncbi:MAG: DUF1987 domain-containing protein [Fulvivirga sp.]